jgi:hypothetical protein
MFECLVVVVVNGGQLRRRLGLQPVSLIFDCLRVVLVLVLGAPLLALQLLLHYLLFVQNVRVVVLGEVLHLRINLILRCMARRLHRRHPFLFFLVHQVLTARRHLGLHAAQSLAVVALYILQLLVRLGLRGPARGLNSGNVLLLLPRHRLLHPGDGFRPGGFKIPFVAEAYLLQLGRRLVLRLLARGFNGSELVLLSLRRNPLAFGVHLCLGLSQGLRVPAVNLIDVCVRLGLHLVLGCTNRRQLRLVLFVDRPLLLLLLLSHSIRGSVAAAGP